MKLFSSVALLSLLVPSAFAHYRFLNLNGSGDYDYIRQYDNHTTNGPITDVLSTDIRCNLNGADKLTGTLTVDAGTNATFSVYRSISHAGPLLFYMAKAPGQVNGWPGDGDVWFKIAETGAEFSGGLMTWPTTGMTSVSVRIPPSVPSGEYILRVEHIGLHRARNVGEAQFYISCAQINVINGGDGNPGPLVSFPGAYSPTDPGIQLNIYWPVPTSYTPPGPPVWQG